jgi:hypothetical protein
MISYLSRLPTAPVVTTINSSAFSPCRCSLSPNLPPLLSGKIALSRQIIRHFKTVQECVEQLKISCGVQYELAHGVFAMKWSWGDITDHVLRQLRGSNTQAAYGKV